MKRTSAKRPGFDAAGGPGWLQDCVVVMKGSVPSLAVVVFTDLVGSTALRTRVGEDVAEELRRRHDAVLGEAVNAHAGRVVKGLGDGIMAVFPGASEAVAAAVAMQQAIARVSSRRPDAVLQIRVGISAGEVTWEEGDCFGTPVVEAARLSAAAEGDQILASDVVTVLAGSRCRDMFTPVGALSLKGLAGPVTAWEVAWEAVPVDAVLPAGLATPAPLSFVGRAPEFEQLSRAWMAAGGGERRVVAVAGEPGIGKTRLLAEFARRVAGPEVAVLYGRAEEGLGVPYGPFVEALDGYVRATDPVRLGAELGPLGGELTRLVPSLAARVPGLAEPLRAEPETERFRLLAAVAEFLAGIAADRPVLVVLDDLHWATTADVLMLSHLLRADPTSPMLVVAAYRDTEVGPGHPLEPLVGDLPRLTGAERVHLSGLDTGDVGELVAEATERDLDDEGRRLAAEVWEETAGNPFFVGEVLRHLNELDPDEVDPAHLGMIGVPDGVREVVGRRLARLPDRAADVLEVAAVIGARFDLPLLLAATDTDDTAVLDILAAGETAALLAPDPAGPGTYRFAHALVQATLYDRLPSTRRLALHHQVGLALEHLPDAEHRLTELARHFTEASPLGDANRAIDYARRAGDEARASLAFEQAALQYENALDLLVEQPDAWLQLRCDLQTALGDVLHRSGDARHRDVLFAAAATARELGDADRLARATLALNVAGEFPPLGDVDHEFIELLDEALVAVGGEDPALRARLLSLLALELMFSPDQARKIPLCDEAMRLARGLGDRATLARVLISAHWGGATVDNVDERLAIADELVGLGHGLGDLEVECWGQLFRFEDCLAAADLDGATNALSRAEQLAAQLHQPALEWEALYRRASLVLLAGRLDEAEQLIFSALEMGTAKGGIERTVIGNFGLQLARLRFEQGRTGEVIEALEAALGRRPDIALSWHAALALFSLECGDPDAACAHFEAAAATDFVGMGDHAWLEGASIASLVAARLGDHPRSKTLYERLAPYAGSVNYPRSFVEEPFDYHLGVLATTLGRYADAGRHLAASEDLCKRMRAPTSLARTRFQLAVMLHARGADGDSDEARFFALAALADAEELGLRQVAVQARELLEALDAV